jgi:SAM-dependent methyltransferase
VVSLAGLQPGVRVLDLATGTGNAALLAVHSAAVVTGVDAAPRLIEVARERAATEGVKASFVVGDVLVLAFEDGAFDIVLSVLGVIFASDARRAFEEMIRVLRADVRALISVWVPAGPIDAMVGTFAHAIATATGSGPNRFAWQDPKAVGEFAARHNAEIRVHEGVLRVTAASPGAYFQANEQQHPMSVARRPLLEGAGTYREVRARALDILREGNEDPQALRVSSPYRVIEVRKPG